MRNILVPILGVFALAIATPACAQWSGPGGRQTYGNAADFRRVAHEHGFREGVQDGERDGFEKGREDAGDRDRFDPRAHRWYRDAERGYDNRYGSRERYRDEYRRGFLAGYEQGYRR
jgi:flagellar biosynthesis/type III secretory pathway protein FliH